MRIRECAYPPNTLIHYNTYILIIIICVKQIQYATEIGKLDLLLSKETSSVKATFK